MGVLGHMIPDYRLPGGCVGNTRTSSVVSGFKDCHSSVKEREYWNHKKAKLQNHQSGKFWYNCETKNTLRGGKRWVHFWGMHCQVNTSPPPPSHQPHHGLSGLYFLVLGSWGFFNCSRNFSISR